MQDLEAYLESLRPPTVDSQWEHRVLEQIRQPRRPGKYAKIVIPIVATALASLGVCAAFESHMKPGSTSPRPPVQIPVRAPIELDGKSKEEILQLRRSAWQGLPEVPQIVSFPSGTQDCPSWKKIVSGMPWIGIQGAVYASRPESYAQRFSDGLFVSHYRKGRPHATGVLSGIEFLCATQISHMKLQCPTKQLREKKGRTVVHGRDQLIKAGRIETQVKGLFFF